MPFHIDYSGPASVSAFMRVEKLKSQGSDLGVGAEDGISSDVNSEQKTLDQPVVNEDMKVDASSIDISGPPSSVITNVKTSGSSTSSMETDNQVISESTLTVESQTSLSSDTTRVSLTHPVLDDADKRFLSTFRGRTIHGLTIDLPSGYSGLVLRGEGSNTNRESQEDTTNNKTESKTQNTSQKASARGKNETAVVEKPATRPRGRLTRSAVFKPAVITIEDEDEEMTDTALGPSCNDSGERTDEQQDIVDTAGDSAIRRLVPQSQFSSFTLWHADRPVNKGNDEYYRSLTEWIALSREVPQFVSELDDSSSVMQIHRTDL